MNQWYDARKTVLETARKMLEEGLSIGTTGNVSLRLPPTGNRQLLVITPTSRDYNSLQIDDMPVIDLNGQRVEG
jgi:ribulose-5-phosphate 4-epimerase/fuculose-1-phosphate aldolase